MIVRSARVAMMAAATSLSFAGCAARPRMCVAPTECGVLSACVAGRCLPNGGTPAIQSARRIVVEPVDTAFLRPGDAPSGGALPPIARLGRRSDGGAVLLLRFRVPLPKDAKVVEAYLLIDRTDAVDSDPTPISLHAARIIEPWDGRSISWARLPRLEETRAPETAVDPAGRATIRLDVRALVQHWREHARSDQGIAVIADAASESGMAIALTPFSDAPSGGEEPRVQPIAPSFGAFGTGGGQAAATAEVSAPVLRQGPRLELYLSAK